MKGLLVLFAVAALAQANSINYVSRQAAALGENPWFVHLRVANFDTGFLQSCAGALIGNRWLLTSNSCVQNARFIWVRHGVVDVWRPELVIEVGQQALLFNNANGLSLVNLNRNVEFTENISPAGIASADDEVPSTGKFCGFGSSADGTLPGETLNCFEVDLNGGEEGKKLTFDEGAATEFDVGAPLVVDGTIFGVLVNKDTFLSPVESRDWIESVTGIELNPPVVESEQPVVVEPSAVNFVAY